MKHYTSRAGSKMRIPGVPAKIAEAVGFDTVVFENGVFKTDNEDLQDWLDNLIDKQPAFRSRIYSIDIAAAEKIAMAQQAAKQQAIRGGVSSGVEAHMINALKQGVPNSFPEQKGNKEPADKPADKAGAQINLGKGDK